ncbi:Uncharacterised protein [Mycobacteroides abscessus]|nr:Uncharacterised protein [Mycobacteroides abscessus]CPV05254.1 Uncharacterised protein [Mycobacteroides abscessus]
MHRREVRIHSTSQYERHCRALGYKPAEITLLVIGFHSGWEQGFAASQRALPTWQLGTADH